MSIIDRLFKREVKELYDEKVKLDAALKLLAANVKDLQTDEKQAMLKRELKKLIDQKVTTYNYPCGYLRASGVSYDDVSKELDELIDEVFKK